MSPSNTVKRWDLFLVYSRGVCILLAAYESPNGREVCRSTFLFYLSGVVPTLNSVVFRIRFATYVAENPVSINSG